MPNSGPFDITFTSATHVGLVRKHNEDACLARPEIGLWVVADGMGGHAAGDFASRSIVDSLARLPPPGDATTFLNDVRTRLHAVNDDLIEEAARRGGARVVIGSTVVAFLMFGGHFACLWAGDSRLYRWRDGRYEQVTRDHSLVQEMVDAGLIGPDAAESHPQANVITRALGTQPELTLDKVSDRLEVGDLFILCTDGLSKMVPDADVARLVAAGSPQSMAQDLVDAALSHGGRDNVTVIAIKITNAQASAGPDDGPPPGDEKTVLVSPIAAPGET